MAYDLQKANLWKRISAGMFDGILTAILAVGIGCLLSVLLGYNQQSAALDQAYAQYESDYGVSFSITQETYESMSQQEREDYDLAYEALSRDEAVLHNYRMVLNLSMVIITLGILSAVILLEFVLPLYLGEGRTLGKKIFGLCLMHSEGIRISKVQLFVRTVLGKFTIETMIPVYIILMLFWGITDLSGTLLMLALLAAQLLILAFTKTTALIHDLLAGTVVVDYASQQIFDSREALIEHQKAVAADRAKRQAY